MIALSFALAVGVAWSASGKGLPRLEPDMPYREARRQLTALGYDPVRVIKPESARCSTPTEFCRAHPEIIDCSGGGIQYCEMLYRRRSDGLYWIVSTKWEPLRYQRLGRAQRGDLEGLVIVKPDGRRHRFVYARS